MVVVGIASRDTQLTVRWNRTHMAIACVKITWLRGILFVQAVDANSIQTKADKRRVTTFGVIIVTSVVTMIMIRHCMSSTGIQHQAVLDFGAIAASDLQTVLTSWDIHARRAGASSICARFWSEANPKSCFFRTINVHASTRQANATSERSLSRASDCRQTLCGARCRMFVCGVAWRITQCAVAIVVIAAQIRCDAATEDSCAGIIGQRKFVVVVAAIQGARRAI